MYTKLSTIKRLQHLCDHIRYTDKRDIVAIVQDIIKELEKKRRDHIDAVKKYYVLHRDKYYEIQEKCYARDPKKRKRQQKKSREKFRKNK